MLKKNLSENLVAVFFLRGHFQASAIQPTLCAPQTLILRSKRRKSSYMTFQTSGPTRDPWEAPHVISFLRDHLSLSYITYLFVVVQQVVWHLLHHRFDTDLPFRGIARIAYANTNQRAESLTLTSSSSCFCAAVYHSLDCVHSGNAFPESKLFLRNTFLPDHKTQHHKTL